MYDGTTPYIVDVTAEDFDHGDTVYGTGDSITTTFSGPTDRGAKSGGKAFVDRLFRFDPTLGADYCGAWVDSRQFVVRALDTVGGELNVCNHDGCEPFEQSNVTVVGSLRNTGSTSPVAVSSAHIAGASGNAAPAVRSFEVSDPDHLDYVFSDGDEITVTFDRATDLGAVEARRRRVDALFSFNIPLGEDYSGQWVDDSVFAITITDTRYDLPLINQTTVTPRVPIRAANGTSVPANATRLVLQGNFGRARRPRLTRFISSRKRRNLGLMPGPPLYSLLFDEPTNRTCSFCYSNDSFYHAVATRPWSYEAAKAAVDEIVTFSVLLGHSYSGEWADATAFEVTIIESLVNTSNGETPTVSRTTANVTGAALLFDRAGRLPASTNEIATLEGNPAELIGPNTDILPLPVLPRVAHFLLVDGGDGGLREDGTFGANATLLLIFNATAHDVVGDVWRHGFISTNVSSAFPGGVWTLADERDPYSGVFEDAEGLQFSEPIGDVYEGTWITRKRLRITVLQPGAHRPKLNQTAVRTVIGGRPTPTAYLSSNIGSAIPPVLLSAMAADPDAQDLVYGSGDTVAISLDRSTDRGGGDRAGNREYVDRLFDFSQTLAYDYSGEWVDGPNGVLDADATFRITILRATCPGCTPMPGVATVKPKDTAFIRTRAASSPRASAPSPPLKGDYGKTRGVKLVSFVADDFDNGDDVYGSGDTLTVVFDLATDRGGVDEKASSVNIEDMLEFSHSLGTDVLSQWRDDSTLVVTVISPTGAADVLVGKTTARPRREVRNKGCCASYTRGSCLLGTACCCYNATDDMPVLLAGDFGNLLPPAVESFVGDDPDDGDAQYGRSDMLLVRFDMATNRGRGDPFGGKAWVATCCGSRCRLAMITAASGLKRTALSAYRSCSRHRRDRTSPKLTSHAVLSRVSLLIHRRRLTGRRATTTWHLLRCSTCRRLTGGRPSWQRAAMASTSTATARSPTSKTARALPA